MKKWQLVFIIIIFPLLKSPSFAQQANEINVFVDCDFCDIESLKQNVTYVNYVLDRKMANVHALFTRQFNASQGSNIRIQYYGIGVFQEVSEAVSYSIPANSTQLNRISQLIDNFQRGLLTFILRTPLKEYVSFDYKREEKKTDKKDKWNSWVFTINANGRYSKEISFESISGSGSLSIQRITDQIKFRSFSSYFKRQDNYTIEGAEIQRHTKDFYSSNILVKSINDHWSYGGEVVMHSSFYENIQFRHSYWLAVEYNLFPYSESARRQFRITPELGYDFRTYSETTIFDKDREGFFALDLLVALEMKEKWGSTGLNIEAVSFLYDIRKYQLSIWSFLKLRLFKGFSFSISGNADMIRNQISLPQKGLSNEDILLQQRQLATDFRFNVRFGISYTLGSSNNNVVNNRFGS